MAKKRQYKIHMFYLLILGIFCLLTGALTITVGALIHANPNVSVAALFKIEPFVHWVAGVWAML